MTAINTQCPSEAVLSDFGLGKLDAASAETVSRHIETCATCRQRVANLPGDSFVGRLQKAGAAAQPVKRERTYVPGESLANAASSTDGSSVREDGLLPRPSPTVGEHAKRDGLGSPSPPVSTPTELANHPDYELIQELGQGGMGTVYLAKNRMMDRPEVLKVIGQALLNKPGVRERFLQEIRAVANLDHPNIVAAYSVSRLGDSLTFAMAYVKGQNLEQVVNARGPLPVANAAFYIHQVALGLQHAHEKGKVHRDIKPNNLMLAIDGKKHTVKILDFGLAKAMSEKDADWAGDAGDGEASRIGGGLTRIGQMLGTPDYVAPEQTLDAHGADTRADIYSLGCTLYFLLSGGPPFPEATLGEILEAHHKREPKPLNLVRPDVPLELATVVAKMMAKDPAKRYQTPLEVAKALTPFFKPGQSIVVPPPVPAQPHPVAEAEHAIEPPPVVFPIPVARPLPVATVAAVPTADVLEEFNVSADTHRHPVRPRRGPSSWPPRQKAMVCLAICAAAILFMLGVSLIIRMPKGEVEIVLSDPKADVTVTVDGNRIDIGGLDEPISLEVGEHSFKVTGQGYETIADTFTVTKGSNPQLTINLRKRGEKSVASAKGPVDLLKKIDPRRDKIFGEWKLADGTLVAPATHRARLQIPYDAPDNYKLTIVVDYGPEPSPDGMLVGLRVGERQVCAVIDGHKRQVSGLELVDGRESDANATTKPGRFLHDGQPNTIVCTVRNNEIRVTCNDTLITDWNDDVNRLSVHENFRMPNSDWLFIGCGLAAFRITKLELSALEESTGEAASGGSTVGTFQGPGLKAELFRDRDLKQLVKTRVDPQIDLMSGLSPRGEASSRRWTGWLKPPGAGRYRFALIGDDGIRLWLNGRKIIDLWGDHSPERKEESVELTGEPVQICVEHYDDVQCNIASLRWTPPDRSREEPIPASVFYQDQESARQAPAREADRDFDPASGQGLKAEIYRGSDFGSKVVSRFDPDINWAWGRNGPAPEAPVDRFSIRWSGWLRAPEAGPHRLSFIGDDGVRIWIDRRLVIDDWRAHFPRDIGALVELPVRAVPIRVEYFEDDQSAVASLRWIRPNSTVEEVVPRDCLFQQEPKEPSPAADGKPPVDLLKLIDPKRHSLVGQWQLVGGRLVAPDSDRATGVEIPFEPPEEYRLTVVVDCSDHSDGFHVGLVVGESQVSFLVDGCSKSKSGLESLDGKIVRDNPAKTGCYLRDGIPNTIVCEVRKHSIRATCNGVEIVDWKGDPKSLSVPGYYPFHNPQRLFLLASSAPSNPSAYHVTRLEIEPLDGQGARDEKGLLAAFNGWTPLFNGKDLTGWKPHPTQPAAWRVENGILIGTGAEFSYLFSERGDFTNFHLRVEARINQGGDSGVFFRTTFGGPLHVPDGYEAQINKLDELERLRDWHLHFRDGYEGQINNWEKGVMTGTLFAGGRSERRLVGVTDANLRPNEWFTLEAVAVENHIEIKVNGQTTAEHVDTRGFAKGQIALQEFKPHTVVEFRKIEIKELSPGQPKPVGALAPARPPTPPRDSDGTFVDLLKRIEPKRDAVAGEWKIENGQLVSPASGMPRLDIPYEPPAEYRLTAVAECATHSDCLVFGLPMSGSHAAVLIDGWRRSISGLENIDGQLACTNRTTQRGCFLDDGHPNTIVCTVRKRHISVVCNGKPLIAWGGDPKRLSPPWVLRNPRRLVVGSVDSSFRLARLEVEPFPEFEHKSVPPDGEIVKGCETVARRYGKQMADRKAATGKKMLCEELLSASLSETNAALRYALLDTARGLAIAAEDPARAFEVVDEIADRFDIDPLDLKIKTLKEALKDGMAKAPHGDRFDAALQLIATAGAADRFEEANRALKIAQSIAKKSAKDSDLNLEIKQRKREIDEQEEAYVAIKAHLDKLASDPDDADANLVAGRYCCFVKDDWDAGLKHLSKGSNATLKDLAKRDLANPTGKDEQRALGDGYWELSQMEKPPARKALAIRARHWYWRAVPWIGGDTVIEDRLKQIDRGELAGKLQFLSELPEQNVVVGWAQLGKGNDEGRPIASGGKPSPHGLITHPQRDGFASVTYDLARRARIFNTHVGLNCRYEYTPLVFQVFGDGKLLWMSPPLKVEGDLAKCEAALDDVRFLELRVNCPGWSNGAHAAWFEPEILWK
jgi:serine/threonine protein kinase